MAKDTKPKKAAPEEVTGEENRKKALSSRLKI